MDKRSLLFVFAVTVSIFIVNLFFNYYDTKRQQEWLEKQKTIKAKQLEQLHADIERRTASVETLSLVRLYLDEQKKEFLTFGVAIGKGVLALPWNGEIPALLYAQKQQGQKLQPLVLLHAKESDVLLYSEKGASLPALPLINDLGHYDLQLLSFYRNEEGEHTLVTLAEYVDGQLIVLGKGPETDAIALMAQGKEYLPVGLFRHETSTLQTINQMPSLATFFSVSSFKKEEQLLQKKQEKFYALENSYLQLVFTNKGAALAEINLPFKSDTNPYSVVKSISFDQEMVSQAPSNAHFPAHPHYVAGNPLEQPQGQLGGYYPLLRRDVMTAIPRNNDIIQARYYALNVVSEYPEVAELIYELKTFEPTKIVFEAVQLHRRITKTYTLDSEAQGAPYCFTLDIKVEGDGRGLWITTGVPEVELLSGSASPTMKYRITRNGKAEVENLGLPKDSVTVTSLVPDWICNSNGFLGLIVDPLTEIDPGYMAQHISGNAVPSRLIELGKPYHRFTAAEFPGYNMLLPLRRQGGAMQFRIFAGPFATDILKSVDEAYSNPATGYNPDYLSCQNFYGWFSFISEPFAKFLLFLMKFFYSITHSWAASIVLLTIALRIMMYPLNTWSLKSMKKMQDIAPELTKIQEKYKKDPKKAQAEIMNLYRTRGVNPVSGCFPMLIQLPFLIGMFDLLKSTFELRGASFIPGWIDNLTAPDVLFRWDTPIFLIGNEFHLLPILLGGVMYFQQKFMTPLPKDSNKLTDQQKQQKMMAIVMPILFTVMFYQFASGLNIYWLSSMLLGILQQWYTMRQMKNSQREVKESA